MKICGDNIEKLEYNKKKKCLILKRIVKNGENKGKIVRRYFSFENCLYCNKEILGRSDNKKNRFFCGPKCKALGFHSNESDETKKEIFKKISETRKREKTGSKEGYIKNYGNVEGLKRYNSKLLKSNNSINSFILRHGEEEGKIKYDKFIERTSISHTLYGYIYRYGQEEGERKGKQFIERIKYTSSFEYYKDKYGDNAKEKGAEEKISNFKHYSMESLKVFIEISNGCIENGYCKKDNIYMGDSEYFLRNNNKSLYFYDFVILNHKILIEYNGIHIHPHIEMSKEKGNEGKHAFNGWNADESHEGDQKKINIAKEKGFKVLEIGSNTSKDDNVFLCKNFIENIIF